MKALQKKLTAALPDLLRAAVEAAERPGPIVATWVAGHATELRDPDLLRAVYGDPATRLRFVDDGGGLSAAGARLREALARADEHGLEPARYGGDQLAIALRGLERPASRPAVQLAPGELVAARAALRRAVNAARPLGAAFETLVGPASPLPALARSLAEARQARRSFLLAAAPVEALLADGLLRFARDLSRGNTAPAELLARWAAPASRPTGAAPASRPTGAGSAAVADATQASREAQVRARLRQDLLQVKDDASLKALLADLAPRHPQYGALQAALRRYREIVSRGGWQSVPPLARLPRKGRAHPLVGRLKSRLAAEGWLAGPPDDRADDALERALRDYQRAHQLREGALDAAFFQSLNVPATERLQEISLTLERWRESAIGELLYYVLINVPDFHLEVWKRGRLLLRERVVVGKTGAEKCDEETSRKVLAFATPLQAAQLKNMVFSPYWNVTRTIRETELEPERGKDPEFYEKNGYEIMKADTPGEWVRQLPGPQNPLGFVKFLFPNPHETYLHDTPEKTLFERPVRAFSHGCVRVEDAWRLAQLLLTEDGQWDVARFGRLNKDWQGLDIERLKKNFTPELYESWCKKAAALETTVALRRPVPVLVEYYAVRVDEGGRVQFLSDIYQLDRARRSPRAERSCVPESKLAQRRFSQAPSRLEALERRSRELAPPLQRALETRPALEGNRDWEVRRLLRRAKKLERFPGQVGNLAGHIRDQHEQLAEALDGKPAWSKRRIEAAVRLERLMSGLEKLLDEASAVTKQLQRLAAGG